MTVDEGEFSFCDKLSAIAIGGVSLLCDNVDINGKSNDMSTWGAIKPTAILK